LYSYFASKQLFPDPKSDEAQEQKAKIADSDAPTVQDMKDLEPQNIQVQFEKDEFVLSFETSKQVGSTIYVTPNQDERVDQAMKDYRNGVTIDGRWFTVASDSSPETTHIATIPNSLLSKEGQVYYYVLISYKGFWLPYGDSMDYNNGPRSPYLIKQ